MSSTKRDVEIVNFLGIGAPKAGTTWLWKQLNSHPQIWLPPRKEIHYFDRSTKYPTSSHLASDSVLTRAFGVQKNNREYRRLFLKELIGKLSKRKLAEAKWTINYFSGPFDDEWYRSLFSIGQGKVCGEISPGYSLLDDHDVKRVNALLPNAKIIYILRDPVERAWSQVRYEWTRGRRQNSSNVEELIRRCREHKVIARGRYSEIIARWSGCYTRNQVFVGFFDEMITDPASFLEKVLNFLEVKDGKERYQWPKEARRVINASKPQTMPAALRKALCADYQAELESLAQQYGDYPKGWLARCRIA
ncbi:MAG: sulfotransferase [Gammaproteobacteria bacterium]|nr:sulfotransferase [Gammaproteobacteria bacterium]